MAGLAAGFIRFIGFLFPVVATPLFVGHLGHYEFAFTTAQPAGGAGGDSGHWSVNYFSVRMSGAIQILLTSLKIGAILVIIFGGISFSRTGMRPSLRRIRFHFGIGTLGALLTALVPAMWAYNGFNDLGDLGEEIVQPQKNIPRAILLGLGTVGALYITANAVYLRVLPFAAAAGSTHIASDAVQTFAGTRGAEWLTIAMAVSAMGALHVVVLTGARDSLCHGSRTASSFPSLRGACIRHFARPAERCFFWVRRQRCSRLRELSKSFIPSSYLPCGSFLP